MSRITTLIGCVLVLAAVLLFGRHTPTQAAANTTNVCGAISTTTWTLANSPYDVCFGGVTVGPTATLTIQPGVIVQFENSLSNKLTVLGALSAIGTVTQPVTFTGVVTTPGSWAGLYVDNVITPALANLSYVTLDDGGVNNSSGAQLYADRAVVTITHSLVRNGAGNGLYLTNRTRFDVHTTNFVGNGRAAIAVNPQAADLLMTDLSALGNGIDGVYLANVSTYLNGSHRWANPGIPYVIDDQVINQTGDVLTIDPGADLQFTSNSSLNIGGRLAAIGLPDQPITLTAQNQTPGGWRGLVIDGGTQNAVAQLNYATIEYGGGDIGGANIVVRNGQLIARHSIVRYSAKDGLQFGSRGTGSILNSQIISNSQIVTTTYGVYNDPTASGVLATNDWWGDPNGPHSDLNGCSTGHGDKVTSGVIFRPVLTSTNLNAEFPLSAAPQLTLTPRRWFAPADGITRVYFDITLRDGNGAPLAGRQTRLHTTRGNVADGGITDVTGHTLAYIVANNGDVGDANVSATLDGLNSCEAAMSPTTKVTFTTPINTTDLFPDSPAPYVNGGISLTPQPIVTGIPETMSAKLTNPLTVPITVDVEFGFAQSSIGLAFGPIKDIVGQIIPANSSVTVSAVFTPVVSGHYCVQVSYNITAIGPTRLLRPQGGSQLRQFNINPQQGPTMPPSSKDSLNKADNSIKKVKKLAPRGTNIQMGIFDQWWGWVKETTSKIDQSLGGDPPRQDYNVSTLPVWYRWPHTQPDANISAARAAALNAASDALADVVAYGTAADTALDRYGGASQAKDLTWAAQQANAQIYYEQQMGTALLTYADKLDAFVQVLNDEHETNITVTVGDVMSYQQSLAATGFTDQEKADAKLVGLTDNDIEAYRQEIIAAVPNDLAGNILDMYYNESFVSRNLGNTLLHPYAFLAGLSVGGSAGLRPSQVITLGNTLAQIGNTSTTIQVGNPLTSTTTIDLRVRRIDLPADWAVTVSPAQITLAPGEVTTVTVNTLTGSPAPQGSVPRAAVEGYVGSQLLGGVAVDVVVPNYIPYFLHAYLPLIRR